jgi:hypothetical protein
MEQTQPPRVVTLPFDVQQMISGLPEDIQDAIDNLPPDLWEVAAQQPDYVNRRDGAALVSKYVLRVAPRSLELWRVPRRRIGRDAMTPPIVLFAIALSKRAAGQISMGGNVGRPAAAAELFSKTFDRSS